MLLYLMRRMRRGHTALFHNLHSDNSELLYNQTDRIQCQTPLSETHV